MMAVNINSADTYIGANCIVIEDWDGSDAASKQRLLNVAGRTLSVRYPTYTIPDEAAYEFANVLATVFNDTNKLGKQGISSFTLDKTASFNFKEAFVIGPDVDPAKFIPQAALDLIGEANGGIKLSKRAAKWTVI